MKNGRYEEYDRIAYYKDGVLHREDGPAIEWTNGNKEWWVNGLLHREDGPAFITRFGRKEWYTNGKLHRLDGPAYELADGSREWWIDGQIVDVVDLLGSDPSVPLSEEEQMILRLSA